MVPNRLTIADKLLLAALLVIEEKGKRTFSAEDLVVSAWKLFPDAFSLAGYSLPDSNRVFAEVMGSKPLRQRGFVRKAGQKMYRLTEAGLERAKALGERKLPESDSKVVPMRETSAKIKKILSSKAFDKYKLGKADEITFYDACAFWDISPRSSAIQFEGSLKNLYGVLDAIRMSMAGKEIALQHGAEPITLNELDLVVRLDQELQERYQRDLNAIRRRTDERKTQS